MNFRDLFPEGDYRHDIGLRKREASGFFLPENPQLLDERARWLDLEADSCAGIQEGGETMLEETIQLAQNWGIQVSTGDNPRESCVNLGRALEPDFLLLKPDENGEITLFGGCVCFPSNWSFEEKLGKSLNWIHAVVPNLNEELGSRVDRLLRKLQPGFSWERANWGLSRSPELNLHPKRETPKLSADVGIDEVWFRVERQALVTLPDSGGILFGIRLEIWPLADVKADSVGREGLHRALATMPERMAVYKSIAVARQQLLTHLK